MLTWPGRNKYQKKKKKKKLKSYITTYKMGKELITFGNIVVEKYKFHQYKTQCQYIMWISKEVSIGENGVQFFMRTIMMMEKLYHCL